MLLLQAENGYALQDILTHVHPFIFQIDFPANIKLEILEKLADIEYQLSAGGSERVQLPAFISIFQSARDMKAK